MKHRYSVHIVHILVTALFCCLGVGTGTAHHSSVPYFELNKTVSVEGVITKVLWANPHAVLYLDVKTSKGSTESWIVYGYPPNLLARSGLTKEMFKAGMTVSAIGNPANDHGLTTLDPSLIASDKSKSWRMMEVGEVRLPDGKTGTFGRGPKFDGKVVSGRQISTAP